MKTKLHIYLAALLLLTGFIACHKSLDPRDPESPTGPVGPGEPGPGTEEQLDTIPYPQHISQRCSGAPDYGDSILYMRPGSTDIIAMPLNQPDSGEYFSWPTGMVLDRNSGAINISRSEGGVRYHLGYVKKGTADTCIQTIILGGASYADSIYVLEDDHRYAKPFFNANTNLVNVCSGSGVPGGGICEWDVDGTAERNRIKIDNNTGVIDLENTLKDNAFGLLALDGSTVKVTLAYRLNDNSSMATQYMPVTLMYYRNKSSVPSDLKLQINLKLSQILTNDLLLFSVAKPRPPIIVVTRYK